MWIVRDRDLHFSIDVWTLNIVVIVDKTKLVNKLWMQILLKSFD